MQKKTPIEVYRLYSAVGKFWAKCKKKTHVGVPFFSGKTREPCDWHDACPGCDPNPNYPPYEYRWSWRERDKMRICPFFHQGPKTKPCDWREACAGCDPNPNDPPRSERWGVRERDKTTLKAASDSKRIAGASNSAAENELPDTEESDND